MIALTIRTRPVLRRIAEWAVRLESWYFDKKNRIETQASAAEQLAGMADVSAGFWYLPTRPSTLHMLLRELPVSNYSDHIFIDIGSGKGRVLLIAAQYGFQRVVGVELRRELHERALQNVQSWLSSKSGCSDIQCLNINARDYVFPDENLVLYLFNPFGDDIMKELMSRLNESLDRCPRDVVLVMIYPEHASAVEEMPRMTLYRELRRCRIYRSRG